MPFADIRCPYCGESIELFVDASAGAQRYAEDCQVCCRPIDISMTINEDGGVQIRADSENEA